MTFACRLERLRKAAFEHRRGERPEVVTIERRDLKELIVDFDRLDKLVRDDATTHDSDNNNAPATDDLSAKLAEWEALANAMYSDRQTITPDNAFEAFQRLNTQALTLREAIPELIAMVRARDATIKDRLDWKAAWHALDTDNARLRSRATAAEARLKDLEGDPDGTAAHVEAFMNRATAAEADAAAARKRVRELENAARFSLNFIENTEGELGIVLHTGNALRAALGRQE